MDLKGAVAVVTGGNGGLGQRICHALRSEGVNIAVGLRAEPRPGRGRRARLSREHRSTPRPSPAT